MLFKIRFENKTFPTLSAIVATLLLVPLLVQLQALLPHKLLIAHLTNERVCRPLFRMSDFNVLVKTFLREKTPVAMFALQSALLAVRQQMVLQTALVRQKPAAHPACVFLRHARMQAHVPRQRQRFLELFRALAALVRPVFGVFRHVLFQLGVVEEFLVAHFAADGFLALVPSYVRAQARFCAEFRVAEVAGEFRGVHVHVVAKVYVVLEFLRAVGALELSALVVDSLVLGQAAVVGECLLADVAFVRFFACVQPSVFL